MKPQEWILANYDRESFVAFMHRVEVLLMNNLGDLAVEAFRQYRAWTRREPPSMDSSVFDVLPVRIAIKLDEAGYQTLRAACMARPEELMQVDNLGDKSIELIRTVARAAQQGKRLPDVVTHWAGGNWIDLQAEFEIDWDYFAQFAPRWHKILKYINTSPERQIMSSVSTETQPNTQLSILLKSIENSEQTVAQINAEIEKREAELAKLKQLRKLLGGKSSSRNDANASFADVEKKIIDCIREHGPLRPKDVKKVIDIDAAHIGRVVSRSIVLSKTSDGKIQLKK